MAAPANVDVVNGLVIMAQRYRQILRNPDRAVESYTNAIGVAKSLPDLGPNWAGLVVIYEELADYLDSLGHADEAKAHRQEAQRIKDVIGSN